MTLSLVEEAVIVIPVKSAKNFDRSSASTWESENKLLRGFLPLNFEIRNKLRISCKLATFFYAPTFCWHRLIGIARISQRPLCVASSRSVFPRSQISPPKNHSYSDIKTLRLLCGRSFYLVKQKFTNWVPKNCQCAVEILPEALPLLWRNFPPFLLKMTEILWQMGCRVKFSLLS